MDTLVNNEKGMKNMLEELRQAILSGEKDAALLPLYIQPQALAAQRKRYAELLQRFALLYGAQHTPQLFSAPGRTEIGGNHTDHNHGSVLAASVNLDAVAAVAATQDSNVRVQSDGYSMSIVNLHELGARADEKGQSASLLRGVLAGFQSRGYHIGGFDAAVTSQVLSGSGLSSSASYEVLLGTVLNHLYNDGRISAVEIAQIAQQAENLYFGKPCGLMDQTASSVGSCVSIDFRDPAQPVIERVDFDLDAFGYALCITDTGGNHADLTYEYAAIQEEMQAVAAKLGGSYLREVEEYRFRENIPVLREVLGDRAVLRALHFYADHARVAREVAAIRAGDMPAFLAAVTESGYSSYMYNQNIYASALPREQPVSLGLALSEELLRGRGAWRVHGGGFAGTIQAFVPKDMLEKYREKMESVFGQNACYILSVRQHGGVKVF